MTYNKTEIEQLASDLLTCPLDELVTRMASIPEELREDVVSEFWRQYHRDCAIGDLTGGNNVDWLVSCPSGDQNFKNHLQTATAAEIEEALAFLITHNQGGKGKRELLESKLRQLKA